MWVCNEHSNLHHVGFWADALPSDSEAFTSSQCPLQICGREGAQVPVGWAYHRDPLGVRIELVDTRDETHDGRVHVPAAGLDQTVGPASLFHQSSNCFVLLSLSS